MERAQPPERLGIRRIARNRTARGGERPLWLGHEDNALRQHKACPERLARPGDQRVPGRRLTGNQFFRALSAIEDEIGSEIFLDFRRNRLRGVGDAVDDRIGEARQRHGGWADGLALRAAFCGQGFGKRKRRRGKRSARRCLHRPSIERETEAPLAFRNADLLVKAAPQLRARAAARRLGWIERLVAEQLLENVAHRKSPAAFAPLFPQRMTWTWRRGADDSPRGTPGACEETASRACTRRKRLRPKRRRDAAKRPSRPP